MSSPRLGFATSLMVVVCLPLMTAACGVPIAVTAVSYGADAGSLMSTGKTGGDHLVSMASKKDCALWRMVRNQKICKDLDDPNANPYDVDYTTPERVVSEEGVSYLSPPRPASDTMPAQSWDAASFKAPSPATPPKAEPTTAVAEQASAAQPEPTFVRQTAASAPVTPKAKKAHSAKAKPKAATKPKPSPDQAASRS